MVKQDLLTRFGRIPVLNQLLLSLLFLLTFSIGGFGQAQIVCNDNVQASLDGDCQAVIRPDMILEGPLLSYAPPFVITIGGSNVLNNNTNAPIITKPGFYNVTVTNSQGNYCWGTITVEDKLPPVVDCLCPEGNTDPSCEFACVEEDAFLAGKTTYPKTTATDACSPVTTEYSDRLVVLGHNGCEGRKIIRTWIFKDASGNKSTCVSEYRFLPASLDDVTLGAPYNTVHLTCKADVSEQGIFAYYTDKLYDVYLPTYLSNVPGTYPTQAIARAAARAAAEAEAIKYAYPTINGVPVNGKTCNMLASKSDTEIRVCDLSCSNSKKVIRTWTILDWCNSTIKTLTQMVIAVDEEAPTIQVQDVSVSVDAWSCEGNLSLPKPDVLVDNCDANPTYRVVGPLGVRIIYDAATKQYIATGVPKGNHTFTYIASDCCGNEREYDITVSVVDKTPPIAVAKQHIVISLTTDGLNSGTAKLFANSVDNGSYDSCTPVHLEIRREKDNSKPKDGCGYTGNFTYNDDGHPFDGSSNPSSSNYDPDQGAYVKFCCDDLTDYDGDIAYGIVKVWMRVWDDGDMNGQFGTAGDNYNETWVEVRVEDKLPPKIICPPTAYINCDDDAHDLTITGKAIAFSNCKDLDVTYTDKDYLSICNAGRIERTWRVKGNNNVLCVQTIYVGSDDYVFSERDITWPQDVTTNCADISTIGKPTWTSGPCDMIGVSLKSDTFYFEGNACMKILNRWTVMNWCTYDPNASNPIGYYTHTQVVKVIDDEKPVLGSCDDRVFEVNDHGDEDGDGNICEIRNLTLTMTATDQGQCASNWLKWIVNVDLYGDGVIDYEYSSFLPSTDVTFDDTNGNGIKDVYVSPTGQGEEVRVRLPIDLSVSSGTHKVTWKVVDGCGNVTACTQNFRIVDRKKPTPYCLHISSALMLNGEVELWAEDFNLGSFDNCTSKSNLRYTFDEAYPVASKINQIHYFKGNGQNATEAEYNLGIAQKWLPSSNSSGRIFNCDDLPYVDVKMTVWDESGNYDYCVVRLNLADNQGACGSTITTSVSGQLLDPAGNPVTDAEIALDNGRPEMLKTVSSKMNGYSFQDAVMYYDYNITGKKNDDYLNGVSTLDLVLIQRHILGLAKITNPYYIIAADINSDGRVTASDMSELRKLILGIYNNFPNNDSWRFVNSNAPFTDATNPFPFKEQVVINNLSNEMKNQNFVAVKIGDVNGTAKANIQSGSTETRSNVALTSQNAYAHAGEIQTITLSADVEDVYGMQFTLDVNHADLLYIYVGGQRLEYDHIAKMGENRYTVSWNDIDGVSGQDLISIQIQPNTDGNIADMIEVNSSLTQAEVYAGDALNVSKLSLRFTNDNTAEFAMYQNEPNPFTEKTQIAFSLPEAADATLKIFDVNGQIIYSKTGSFGKGMNTFTLNKKDLPSTGVMIYQVESGNYISTKKMIGLE
ncbi:MAG: T9SS type A sorting domain-containing protein [Chitinophagales bacterium]|nr:T9SS type A sorting domain-containing protein [Chitinophagales bacterium]